MLKVPLLDSLAVLFACLATIYTTVGQCAQPQINAAVVEHAKPWTSLNPLDDDNEFYFAVVTDRTGGHRKGVFSSAMDKLNLLQPAFVVSVGDLIEGYTENPIQLKTQWNEIESFVARLQSPFFYAPGNHDMSNALMAHAWQERFGPSFYHFTYKGVVFVVLNSELFGMVEDPATPVPGPWRQQQQMDFVRSVLQQNSDARWTVVLIHQPLWDPSPVRPINRDWLAVEELLGSRNYTVFAGHYHQYTKTQRHNRKYITLATTGGGSSLRGSMWGEFDHVALVKMAKAGPIIANLTLDGILTEDVSTSDTRQELNALKAAVTSKSRLNRGAMFTHSTQTIQISNPLTSVVAISAKVGRAGNFAIEGLRNMTIEPGASTTFDLLLSAAQPIAYRDLTSASINWTLSPLEASTTMQRQVSLETPVLPLTVHQIPKITQAPVIDGNLQDWPALPFEVAQQGDISLPQLAASDISFRFGLSFDADNLYVGVTVTDDNVVADPNLLARLQDAIAIAVDTRPAKERNTNMNVVQAIISGFYNGAVTQVLTVEGASEDTFIPILKTLESAVTSAVTRTATGYSAELAIPNRLLDKASGATWQEARIGIRTYDLDEPSGTIDVLHWQPYRYGNAPLTDSHAFTRDLN